ncbi:MAG: Ig-like domain-containing protein [Chitinispirillaceae bacterium]|nr:Ig-like domain-containing protein [Chitinispirillaceae bacterium]
MSFRIVTAAFPLITLVLFCAHQLTPSGGPDDRTGPSVQSVEPAQGTVDVKPRSRCVITFSEWLSKKTAEKSVTVLPSLEGGAKVRVSGRRLEITPRTAFADSTTYHITVTGTLQDLHGNPLPRSFTLVFSTGPALDKGKIVGCVIDPPKRASRPIAALFRRQTAETDSVIFTEPDYLTEADSAGFFSIENVRPGGYRLIAFIDKNGNRRLDPGVEDAYAPLLRIISASPQADTLSDTLSLFPAASDTAAPRLESVKPLSPKIIISKLTLPLDSAHGCFEPRWTLESLADTCPPPAIAACRWLGGRTRCVLLLAGPLSGAPYRLICGFKKMKEASIVSSADTVRFNGVTTEDTLAPALTSRPPAGFITLLPEIRLHFSEPVTLTMPLFLADSLGDTVPFSNDSTCADTLTLVPQRRLRPGSVYRLVLLKSSGSDMAGNPLRARDTTDTAAAFRLTVIAADSLAVSLKGGAPCLPPSAKRKWRFIPFSGGKEEMCPDSAGCFRFDSIPYGRGNIGYFIDENGNGRPDAGSLVPWTAPEPSIVFPDTIEARARWESESITFARPCGSCTPYKAVAPPPGTAGKKGVKTRD